jgi:N-ethylmaleimide reductase
VAPSAIAAKGRIFTDAAGLVDYDAPEALSTADIAGVVEAFASGARNAVAAGFDGVELHGTGGYLAAQFMATGTNIRTDRYGGGPRNRARFVVETLEAMAAAVGANRVGLKIGPGNPLNDLTDDEPAESFAALLNAVDPLGLAYLHLVRVAGGPVDNIALARAHFGGPIILNSDYGLDEAARAVEAGEGAAVSFGRAFVANPDLPERFYAGTPLAGFDRETLYATGPRGYVDYPPAAL